MAAFLEGQARSAPLPTSGPPSPGTRSVLSSMFSSFDDEANPNRCGLVEVINSLCACIWSVEAWLVLHLADWLSLLCNKSGMAHGHLGVWLKLCHQDLLLTMLFSGLSWAWRRLVVDAQPPDTLETLTAAGTALASVDLVPPPEPDRACEPLGAASTALMELVASPEPHVAPEYATERSRTSMAALTQGLCP